MEYERDISFADGGIGSSDDEEMLVSLAAGHVADLAGREESPDTNASAVSIATQRKPERPIDVEQSGEELSRPDRPLEPAHRQERPGAAKPVGAAQQHRLLRAAALGQVAVVLGALTASALIYWLL